MASPSDPLPFASNAVAGPAPGVAGEAPLPPLAFLAIAITGVLSQSGGAFTWTFMAWLVHSGIGKRDMSGTTEVSVGTSAARSREFIATAVRGRASIALDNAGYDVPPDRIAAVVL
jgi:hypothetical protein